MDEQPIVFFDGVCNLCNSAIQWIICHDPKARIQFAPFQSEAGQNLIEKTILKQEIRSVILRDERHVYYKSTAVLRMCRYLKGFWKLCVVFLIIPRPIRDFIYDYIAKNRYKWFGKRSQCMVPTKENKERFLI